MEHYSFYFNTIIRTPNYLGTSKEEQKGWVDYSLHFPPSWFKDRAAHRGGGGGLDWHLCGDTSDKLQTCSMFSVTKRRLSQEQ